MFLSLAFLFFGVALSHLPIAGSVSQTEIYVDPISGIANKSCWTGGEQLPCSTLDLALQGAAEVVSFESISVLLQPGDYNITAAYSFVEKNGFELWSQEQGKAAAT